MPKPTAALDGIARSAEVEAKLNLSVASAFKGPDGKATLDYLRSISIERVNGPHATDAELRHMEGMRFIVGILSQRIALGHQEKQNHGESPRTSTRASRASSRARSGRSGE